MCSESKGMWVLDSTGPWQRYFRWNEAIADVVFSSDHAGSPVYLDLEDHIMSEVASKAEPGGTGGASGLIKAVKDTLVLERGPSQVFAGHFNHLRAWRNGSRLNPPPVLGLLGMLSLVAEVMHEGEGMKANNFWGRMAQLLDLEPGGLKAFQQAFWHKVDGRPVSAQLYDSLNVWLEMLEGNRGLPTAIAAGHQHIGWPLSQALVRETDRDRFGDLFALNALPPRSSLPTFEMEGLIEEWISHRPCPASNSLVRLWKTGSEARARITDVAVLTLGSWDGTSERMSERSSASRPVDVVRATVVLRTFPSRSIHVGLVVPGQSSGSADIVEVVDRDGSAVKTFEMTAASSAYLSLAESGSIDPASFLAGEVLLRRRGDEALLRRRARRVIPMRHDDLLQAWVECERVQLAEESLVLVRCELEPKAKNVLKKIARPGFKVEGAMLGLPEGWIAVSRVQVVSSVPIELREKIRVELNVLQPLATSQAVLEGGLQIPGNIQKWSTLLPPEFRATTDSEQSQTALLTCTRVLTSLRPEDRRIVGQGQVLVWDLAHESLGDGDYKLTVLQDEEPIRIVTLRLRSADTPAVRGDEAGLPIVHDPEAIGFGLVACPSDKPGGFRGARSTRAQVPHQPLPAVPDWYSARRERPEAPQSAACGQFRFPAADDSSCMVTGYHVMSLETAQKGMKNVEGVCKGCGLVKRYPAWRGKPKSACRSSSRTALAPRIDVKALAPVRVAEGIDWSAAFDVVCHVGSGPASSLARIAAQLEGTSLFGNIFERRLEALSHIEIERTSSQMIASWEVVEPLILGLGDGSAVLAGFRSAKMLDAIRDYVKDCQGFLEIEEVDAPPVVYIRNLTSDQLGNLTAVMSVVVQREARYVPRASEQLCAELPPLSRARRGLPTTTTTRARSYERWDPVTARFVQVDNASSAGAFRLSGFTRQYIYRTTNDVAKMRAVIGDARIVKYLAAADAGLAIVGYDVAAKVLYVPLGADLPGLYGRAATLCSGRLPHENRNEQILEYRNIPADVAAHLSRLLMN